MRNVCWLIVCGVFVLAPFAVAAQEDAPAAEKAEMSDTAKIGYALGASIGKSILRGGMEVDVDSFIKGLQDVLSGVPLALTEGEMREAQENYRRAALAKQQEKMKQQAENNIAEEEAFLKEYAAKEGVVKLPSGVQYRVITEGPGPKPLASDEVEVNYRGTFADGTEFDSSYKRGKPMTFQVGKVIPGWREALELMPVGSKWEIVIPAAQGYGERGAPGGIVGPNKLLIFEVELLGIVEDEAEQGAGAPASPGKIIVEDASS